MSLAIIVLGVAGVIWAARVRYKAEVAVGNSYFSRWRIAAVTAGLLVFGIMAAAMWIAGPV